MFIDTLVPRLPEALSPNTITHVGHLLNLSAAMLLLVVRPRGGGGVGSATIITQYITLKMLY